MHVKHVEKIIIIAGIFVIAVFTVVSVYMSLASRSVENRVVSSNPPIFEVSPMQELAQVINVANGWEVYEDSEVFRILFAYPGNWELTENIRSKNVATISLKGDGYEISIRNWGSDVPHSRWTHPLYFVAGNQMQTWEYSIEEGKFVLVLSHSWGNDSHQIVIFVTTPTSSREMADRILSSMVFLK